MSSRLLRWRRRLPGYDRKCEDPLEGGETQVSACACMAFCVDEAMPVLARAAVRQLFSGSHIIHKRILRARMC